MTETQAIAPDEDLPNYVGTRPVEYKGLVLGIERFTDMLPEFMPLFNEHWQDIIPKYTSEEGGGEMKAYWGPALANDAQGNMITVTLRTLYNYTPLGYLLFIMSPSMHLIGNIVAVESGFFIDPAHRKGMLAIKLMNYAEKYLQEIGIRHVMMHDFGPAGGTSLAKLCERRGYTHVSQIYMKEFGE